MKKVIYPIVTIILILLIWLLSSQKSSSQKPNQKTTIVQIIDRSWSTDKKCQSYILKKSQEGYKLLSLQAYHDGTKDYSSFIIIMEK